MKFKIGDSVLVLEKSRPSYGIEKGEIGTISDLKPWYGNEIYQINNTDWWIYGNKLNFTNHQDRLNYLYRGEDGV